MSTHSLPYLTTSPSTRVPFTHPPSLGLPLMTVPLRAAVAPFWLTEPEDLDLVRGLPAEVQCSADGHPPPLVTWSRPGEDGKSARLPRTAHISPPTTGPPYFLA